MKVIFIELSKTKHYFNFNYTQIRNIQSMKRESRISKSSNQKSLTATLFFIDTSYPLFGVI